MNNFYSNGFFYENKFLNDDLLRKTQSFFDSHIKIESTNIITKKFNYIDLNQFDTTIEKKHGLLMNKTNLIFKPMCLPAGSIIGFDSNCPHYGVNVKKEYYRNVLDLTILHYLIIILI